MQVKNENVPKAEIINQTAAPDQMNWDILSESFGRITTESNSTDGSFEDITKVNSITDNNIDINELLFVNPINSDKLTNETNNIVVDNFDLSGLDVDNFTNFANNKDNNKENETRTHSSWEDPIGQVNVSNEIKSYSNVKPKAMQLALANEIEVHAPWVDVSALAASISETPVSIKEKTPENIFTLATFIPTHIQSYRNLNSEPNANGFELKNPHILDREDKVFNDTELVTNIDASKFEDDIDIFLNGAIDEESLVSDRLLNTSPPTREQQNIEINPANSVLFNTDLDLEDTLLFNNEPASDMYVVRTENIFGKEIAKRNALEKLAADAGICGCDDCKCDPSDGECRNCQQSKLNDKKCSLQDKCSCVDCKCDHELMKCAVGCGMATDTNHNTFLHYHRRHNDASLEELGLYTLEEPGDELIDNLKCSCKEEAQTSNNAASCCSEPSQKENTCCSTKPKDSCCVTICLKKIELFKQILMNTDVVNVLKSRAHLNLTTNL